MKRQRVKMQSLQVAISYDTHTFDQGHVHDVNGDQCGKRSIVTFLQYFKFFPNLRYSSRSILNVRRVTGVHC